MASSPRRPIRIHTGEQHYAAEAFTPLASRTNRGGGAGGGVTREQRSPSVQLLTPHSAQQHHQTTSNPCTPSKEDRLPPSPAARQPSYTPSLEPSTVHTTQVGGPNTSTRPSVSGPAGQQLHIPVELDTPPASRNSASPPSSSATQPTPAPINLHAARHAANAATRSPVPRMFVHSNGETTTGRASEFKKVLETSERRAAARQSLSAQRPQVEGSNASGDANNTSGGGGGGGGGSNSGVRGTSRVRAGGGYAAAVDAAFDAALAAASTATPTTLAPPINFMARGQTSASHSRLDAPPTPVAAAATTAATEERSPRAPIELVRGRSKADFEVVPDPDAPPSPLLASTDADGTGAGADSPSLSGGKNGRMFDVVVGGAPTVRQGITGRAQSASLPYYPSEASIDPHALIHTTLFFRSYTLECEFRYAQILGGPRRIEVAGGSGASVAAVHVSGPSAHSMTTGQVVTSIVGLVLLFFATFAPDAWQFTDYRSALTKKVTLAAIGGALFVLCFALSLWVRLTASCDSESDSSSSLGRDANTRTNGGGGGGGATRNHTGDHRKGSGGSVIVIDTRTRLLRLQPILALTFAAGGCCWSAASAVVDDEVHRTTNALPVVFFLVLGFLLLDTCLFAHLFLASWSCACVYILIALTSRWSDGSLWIQTVSECVFVVGVTIVLCAYAYHRELSIRQAFLRSKALATTKSALQKETAELRNEVFSLVLEKFDIVDVSRDVHPNGEGSDLDLTTPLERSMKLLQELERDRALSKKHFDKIRTIIEQLGGNNENIYRPRMAQIVGSAGKAYFKNEKRTHAREQAAVAAAAAHNNSNIPRRGSTGTLTSTSNGSSATTPSGGGSAYSTFERRRGGGGGGDALSVGSGGGGGRGASSPRPQLDEDTTKWLSGLVDDYTDAPVLNYDGTVAPGGHSYSPAHGAGLLSSEEEATIFQLTEQLEQWDFDVFEVCKLTHNRPLFFIGLVLFRKNDLINKFAIEKDVLCNFLNTIELGYNSDLPYHNSTHAADVTRSFHFFLHTGGLRKDLNDLEVLACLIAAITHDYQHPGVNNNFLLKTHHDLSLLYNDKSILENMHLSSTFKELQKSENNILAGLPLPQYESVRKLVIEMVLATDLGQHFEIVGHFGHALPRLKGAAPTATGGAATSSSSSSPASEQKQLGASSSASASSSSPPKPHLDDQAKAMVLKMALKCSDIAHSAKALGLHIKWSLRIIEEFYRQGDQEILHHLPVSPFMDRRSPNVSRAQIGFIDFISLPMFTLWTEYLSLPEERVPCLRQLKSNRDYWAKRERGSVDMTQVMAKGGIAQPTEQPQTANTTPTTETTTTPKTGQA